MYSGVSLVVVLRVFFLAVLLSKLTLGFGFWMAENVKSSHVRKKPHEADCIGAGFNKVFGTCPYTELGHIKTLLLVENS